MKLWPLFPLFLLAQQPSLLGQGLAALTRQGDEALSHGLWEVAELHFRECLADPSLTGEAKSTIVVRLAESLIRAGNPTEALELLGQAVVAKNPETPFWKAQALAGQNHFSEAAGMFSELLANPGSPHRTETGFTLASLQLALGQADAALDSLATILPEADAATQAEIQLYRVEILLDLKRAADARQAMPSAQAIAVADRPLAAFLEAQLLLHEGRPADAEAGFQALVNHPQGQSLTRHHLAAIGLADAIAAQGNPDAAAKSLLAFLEEHTDSPVLDAIFQRLLQWLPKKPAATDPILERVGQWITPPVLPVIGPIATTPTDTGSAAAGAWPTDTAPDELTDLLAFSIYTRAVGLHRMATPESRAEAKLLLHRLRVENPGHPAASRALYQLARWLLDAGSTDQAFAILDTFRDTAKSPALQGEAAFLKARVACQNGDSKQAIQLFDEAAIALTGDQARAAKLQAAITRLRSGDLRGTTLIQQQGGPPDTALEADLELERALSSTPASAARSALEEFLTRFPDHARAPEARLAALEAALASVPPDLAFAKAQSEILTAAAEKSVALPAPRLALARLHLSDLSNDSAAAIAAAQSIIDTYPAEPAAEEAALTLGRNLFQTGSYNPARLVLEKLAAAAPNPARAQAAWLLAARSAALGGTPQSKEEALILFDKAIETQGPVSSIAALEKARHLIDIYRLAEASAFLAKWTKSLPADDPLHLPAGLLLGEALYAQGSGNPASLVEALAVYDKLLAHAKTHPALFNRLQYLRGTTLEQLPDEKDPAKKREKQAFQAYHSVLETTMPPAEWEYFERCGFRALALLEKAGRWPVAITVAKKIASFKGPRAEEAATRASQLQLKHMIWED
jgi:predicted negative regulator of RcsB-dependent stress response